MALQRLFGIIDDAVAGGADYDAIKYNSPIIPDSNVFWPAIGGTFDAGLSNIDRNAEVRGRRSNTAPLPFRSDPTITVPTPMYRTILEKSLQKCLGVRATSGGVSPAPFLHEWTPLQFGAVALPAAHVQLVRDDLNVKMAGATWNRLTLDFPLEEQATIEHEIFGKYFQEFVSAPPTPTYTVSPDILLLRDAKAYLDGTATTNEVQTLTITGSPTGGFFKLRFKAAAAAPIEETADIAHSATAAAVQTALEALPSIDPGDVVCTGGPLPATGVVITFVGDWAATNVEALTFTHTLTGGSSPTPVITQTTPGVGHGTPIPDLQGFSLTFTNNLIRKPYAGRNIVTRVLGVGPQTKKLWLPAENKAQAAPEITYSLNFGNTVTAQEVALWFAQVQKLVFDCVGGPLAAPYSGVNEVVRIILYNIVHTGGGADALSNREDITSSYDGGVFYSPADSADIKIQIVSDTPAANLA